jgi:antitoxin component YwqK of YwqJK toxin-antitoxin module
MKFYLFIGLILLTLIFAVSAFRNRMDVPANTNIVDAALLKTHRGMTTLYNIPFSGKAFMLSSKGDTVSTDIYVNGKLNGVCKAWHQDGQLSHERFYNNGRKEGIHRGWWPNGKLRFEYEFENDEYHGHVAEWYESGNIFKRFSYNAGHEEGSQRMWRLDGRIYANYVVKNNRIYGLSGRKACKSIPNI